MNGFKETIVPSTHYPSFDGPNPFPIRKEAEPMKLTIKTEKGQLEEYNLWFVGLEPAEMSSMDLAKAVFDVNQMSRKFEEIEIDFVRLNLDKNDFNRLNRHSHLKDVYIVDDNYLDIKNAINEFIYKVNALGIRSGEEQFASAYAYSTRVLTDSSYKKRTKEGYKTVVHVSIDEMYITEMTGEKYGWIVEFKSVVFNDMGQHYKKTWPGVLLMNKTENGYRLMWKNNKSKTPVWAIGYTAMAKKKLVPMNSIINYYVCELRDQLIQPEDVLKIVKWMPMNSETYAGLYPHGITQSDIYWIGGETSVKKILNKAFKHPHGVTKNIFGGINNVKTIEDLRAAIALMQAARGFSPQVLEKLDLREVAKYFSRPMPELKNGLKSFFQHFGFREEFILEMFSTKANTGKYVPSVAHEALDIAAIFKQIKSRKHRVAIKNHIARNKMTIPQIHDFVNAEFEKIRTENKAFVKNKFWKKFGAFDGKFIAEGIQMVVPKMTHELVEWGATQNNCIGSYADRVYDNQTMIIGFKNSDGEWLGHAEITSSMYLSQLLGKHNQPLAEEDRNPIIKFMKNELEVNIGNYWGS